MALVAMHRQDGSGGQGGRLGVVLIGAARWSGAMRWPASKTLDVGSISKSSSTGSPGTSSRGVLGESPVVRAAQDCHKAPVAQRPQGGPQDALRDVGRDALGDPLPRDRRRRRRPWPWTSPTRGRPEPRSPRGRTQRRRRIGQPLAVVGRPCPDSRNRRRRRCPSGSRSRWSAVKSTVRASVPPAAGVRRRKPSLTEPTVPVLPPDEQKSGRLGFGQRPFRRHPPLVCFRSPHDLVGDRRLLHDPGVQALEPIIVPAQRLDGQQDHLLADDVRDPWASGTRPRWSSAWGRSGSARGRTGRW